MGLRQITAPLRAPVKLVARSGPQPTEAAHREAPLRGANHIITVLTHTSDRYQIPRAPGEASGCGALRPQFSFDETIRSDTTALCTAVHAHDNM